MNDTRISQKEMVAEITTPTSQAFTVVGTYAVNPGLSATFP